MLNLIPFLTSESQDISQFEQTDDVDMVEIEDLRQSYEIARQNQEVYDNLIFRTKEE